jgi:hypothetical protein
MPRLWTMPRAAIGAFERAARARFLGQAEARIARLFPALATELGEEKTRAAIERGIAQALDYRIVAERDINRFLDLWFEARFDPARSWPWSASILANDELDGPTKVDFIQSMME